VKFYEDLMFLDIDAFLEKTMMMMMNFWKKLLFDPSQRLSNFKFCFPPRRATHELPPHY
jgi:hypothetical protein